jgi:hypothetical protein
LLAGHASAQDIRIATFAAPLGHKGPGLLLRDMGQQDGQIDAILGVMTHTFPDILLLTNVDYDRIGCFLTRTGRSGCKYCRGS